MFFCESDGTSDRDIGNSLIPVFPLREDLRVIMNRRTFTKASLAAAWALSLETVRPLLAAPFKTDSNPALG
jgi:hypothetical protein